MRRSLRILALLSVFLPVTAWAGDMIYKQPNNPANFVTLEKFKTKEGGLNHPYTFTEDQLKAILRSLKYSKKLILLKESKNRDVFEMEYIDKFTPDLVTAFSKATPEKAVVWSVVQKRPYFIIRNDKLTVVRMWILGQELHIAFLKTEAKLSGDYQAHTTGSRLIEEARGIGVTLEPQQSQKFALDSTEELILDLGANWQQIADNLDAEDERMRQEEQDRKAEKKTAKSSGSTNTVTSTAKSSAPEPKPAVSPQDQKDAQARLQQLKSLKDKGLINEQDYERKKQEILKDL